MFYNKVINDSICYFKFNECRDLQYLSYTKDDYSLLIYPIFRLVWKLRGGNFKRFLAKMFKKIEHKQINHLIIDLSDNQGGSSILCDQLLYYLCDENKIKTFQDKIKLSPLLKHKHEEYYNQIKKDYNLENCKENILVDQGKPKDYFSIQKDENSLFYMDKPKKYDGNVYLIIGEKTFSSAALLAVMIKDNNIANQIVGSPISIKPSHFGEVLSWKLPRTNAYGCCSCKLFIRPNSTNKEETLFPDVEIWNTVEDDLNQKNKALEYLINNISGINQ